MTTEEGSATDLALLIAAAARRDPSYAALLTMGSTEEGVRTLNGRGLRLVSGQLFRVAGQGGQRLLPRGEVLHARIIGEMHDVNGAAHMGRDVTLRRIKQRFYWGGMDREVAIGESDRMTLRFFKPAK